MVLVKQINSLYSPEIQYYTIAVCSDSPKYLDHYYFPLTTPSTTITTGASERKIISFIIIRWQPPVNYYLALLSLTGPYWALLGLTGPYSQ